MLVYEDEPSPLTVAPHDEHFTSLSSAYDRVLSDNALAPDALHTLVVRRQALLSDTLWPRCAACTRCACTGAGCTSVAGATYAAIGRHLTHLTHLDLGAMATADDVDVAALLEPGAARARRVGLPGAHRGAPRSHGQRLQ